MNLLKIEFVESGLLRESQLRITDIDSSGHTFQM